MINNNLAKFKCGRSTATGETRKRAFKSNKRTKAIATLRKRLEALNWGWAVKEDEEELSDGEVDGGDPIDADAAGNAMMEPVLMVRDES